MTRRWPLLLTATFLLGISGCVNLRQNPVPRTPLAPEAKRDSSVIPATYEAMRWKGCAHANPKRGLERGRSGSYRPRRAAAPGRSGPPRT